MGSRQTGSPGPQDASGLPDRRQWAGATFVGASTLTSAGLGGGPVQGQELIPALRGGSRAFEDAMTGVFNGVASSMEPKEIFQPRTLAEVGDCVKRANEVKQKLTIKSGGHSPFCAQNGKSMVDLSRYMNKIEVQGDRVTLMGGAAMGSLLRSLATNGRMVPVGTHGTPGFGLLTQGGLGHLSRSLGFTVDCVVAMEGIRGDGTPFSFRENDPELDLEAWGLLRGAAPFLGVVTQATLRTYPRQSLKHWRAIYPLECADGAMEIAESLPDGCCCSLIFGPAPDGERCILAYAVAPAGNQEGVKELEGLKVRLKKQTGFNPVASWTGQCYGQEQLPSFDIPRVDGSIPAGAALERHERPKGRVFSPFLGKGHWRGGLGAIIARMIREAPGPLCRIDFQHLGTNVQKSPRYLGSFGGRSAEWSPTITGMAVGDHSGGIEKAVAWADRVWGEMKPFANGYYIVQNHPGTPFYQDELQRAFGPRLMDLRKLKKVWDPGEILHPLS